MKHFFILSLILLTTACRFDFVFESPPQKNLFALNDALKVDNNGSLEGTWLVLEHYETLVDVDINTPPTVIKTALDNSLKSLKIVLISEDEVDAKTIQITACNPDESSQDQYLNQDLALDDDRSLAWTKVDGHQYAIAFEDFTAFEYRYSRSQDYQEDKVTANGLKISHNLNDIATLPSVLERLDFTVNEANHNSTTAMQAADNYQPICFDITEQVYDYYNASGVGVDQTINDQLVKAQIIGFKAKSDAGAFVYIKAQVDEADRYSLNPSDMPAEQQLVERVEQLNTAYYDDSEMKRYDEYYRNVDAAFVDGTPHPDNQKEFDLLTFFFAPDLLAFSALSGRVGDELDISFTMKQ